MNSKGADAVRRARFEFGDCEECFRPQFPKYVDWVAAIGRGAPACAEPVVALPPTAVLSPECSLAATFASAF